MMRHCLLLSAALLAGCAASSPSAVQDPGPGAAPLVVGTFDSRVLAVAYYRSEIHERNLSVHVAAYERAKAAGDAAAMAEIDALMQEHQQQAHRQGFGNAPIPEILATIEDRIPEVARAAGVQLVVSKWDVVWQERRAPVVDLSLALAELFEPDEATRKLLPGLMAHEPVPLEDLERSGHDH